jgi:hypothetical protein
MDVCRIKIYLDTSILESANMSWSEYKNHMNQKNPSVAKLGTNQICPMSRKPHGDVSSTLEALPVFPGTEIPR